MNHSIQRISLDIHNAGSGATVSAKRGDTGRKIAISLVEGGVPYIISADCYAVFTAKKPDGNVVFNDCMIENNSIIYEVTEQTVVVEGRVDCEIKLYGDGGKLITSPKFTLIVSGTVYDEGDEVESSDEFQALTALTEELEKARDSGAFKGEKGDPGAALIDDTAVREDGAWSSKNTVDKLCPAFTKSGMLVQCEPVEGYPLSVTGSFAGVLQVTACGKNLYNKEAYPLSTDGYPYSGESNLGMFAKSNTYKRTGFIPVPHLRGQRIVLSHPPEGKNPGISFYTRLPNVDDNADCKDAWCDGTTDAGMVVPEEATYMVFCVKAADADKDVQIELGSVATDYEAYKHKETGNADPTDSVYIEAHKGINTIFAYDDGDIGSPVEVTVSGKADPVAIIEKLTNAVLSLGGNV